MLMIPDGMPARDASIAMYKVENGVISEGFKTTALPVARVPLLPPRSDPPIDAGYLPSLGRQVAHLLVLSALLALSTARSTMTASAIGQQTAHIIPAGRMAVPSLKRLNL